MLKCCTEISFLVWHSEHTSGNFSFLHNYYVIFDLVGNAENELLADKSLNS